MQHIIVYVLVGVLLQWHNVEARPTTSELASRYAKLHPNTGLTEECQGLKNEGINSEINPFNAAINEALKWPDNTLYYSIDGLRFTSSQIQQIEAGIADLQKLTAVNGKQCIKILPRTTQTDYVQVLKLSGCFSELGRAGGKQPLSLANGCFRHGTIMHEFLHALGFFHEQMRTDRDEYILVNYDNIIPEYVGNFEKLGDDSITLLGTRYDYGSVMHYGAYGFGINEKIPTIIPLDENAEIGQRVTLSAIDIERVQIHYGCIDPIDTVFFKHLSR